jgi:HEAT repeat protein
MKKLLLLGALLAVGSLALQDVTVGHGGTYRGPGDTVPPGGGGGAGGAGPMTPGPSGPSGPGAGPSTPGSSGPAGPVAGPSAPGAVVTGGGGVAATDLTVWQFWWGFNKEPYLNLRDAIRSGNVQTGSDDYFIGRGEKELSKDTLRPSEEKIRQVIVPALLEALEKERQNDIVTGAMVALAKIGDAKDEQGESAFQKVIQDFLKDGNQEIAETAAVALGILANDSVVPLLTDLMMDTPAGHKAVGSTSVVYRTRAFAAYGLGLIGYQTEDNAMRQEIAQSLIEVLQMPRQATRDLKVAALTSLGLVPIDPGTAPQAAEGEELVKDAAYYASTRETQVRFALDFFKNEKGEHYLVRAHAPRALSLLVPEDNKDLQLEIIEALVDAAAPRSKEQNEVIQSAVLAMGQIGDCDADKHDEQIREALSARITQSGEPQVKRFAVISLAQVGGRPGTNEPDVGYKAIKKELTTYLARSGGGMSQMKPWIGLSLGVMQNHRMKNTGGAPDNDVAQALRTALIDCKRPMDVGAYCIGAGVAKDLEAKEAVLDKLESFSDDEARGYAAVALGLMGAGDTIEPIQKIVKESKYRPELLKQAAIALGLLGDKGLVDDLVDMLGSAKGLATQAAISSALGFIGDSRSVDPLVEMLQDQSITASARGFAAVALGIVADKEPLPWNAKISVDINYRANTTTLTGGNGTGILDIL